MTALCQQEMNGQSTHRGLFRKLKAWCFNQKLAGQQKRNIPFTHHGDLVSWKVAGAGAGAGTGAGAGMGRGVLYLTVLGKAQCSGSPL